MEFKPVDFSIYNKSPFYPQYLSRGETKKLVSFDDAQLAELDLLIDKMSDQYDLEKANGILLDRIGKLKDEPRNGNGDKLYRLMIRLRILLDTTKESINDIIKLIKFLYASEVVHIVPDYPAGLIIEHDGEGTPGLNFNKLLNEIIPAGVSFSTKEIFNFFDDISEYDDSMKFLIRKEETETFGSAIKYDGSIKYDGHTVNEKEQGLSARLSPPFKYRPGLNDDSAITACDNNTREFLDSHDTSVSGIRKHHFYDGSYKYSGLIKYDSMILFPTG